MWHFFPGPDAALGFVFCFFKGRHEETLGRGRDSVLQRREGSCSAASGKCRAVRTLNCTLGSKFSGFSSRLEGTGGTGGRKGGSALGSHFSAGETGRVGPAPKAWRPSASAACPAAGPRASTYARLPRAGTCCGAPGARAGLDGDTEAALCWAHSRKGGQPARMRQQNERKEKVLSGAGC